MRALVILHRYLGVAVGLIVTLWCLSGVVMMYQSFPDLSRQERLAGLPRLALAGCCRLDAIALPDEAAIDAFSLEMAAGAPVLRIAPAQGEPLTVDARSGRPLEPLTPPQALQVARDHARGAGLAAEPRHLGIISHDQWTVATARRNSPVHHLALGDAAGTELYVNGATGQVFQDTTRRERLLAWFGAIPHWLYPTLLRQHPRAWGQVVIWASVIGLFLTVTGIYLGIARFVGRPRGRLSPFRGVLLWHHLAGLVFGLLTLTWTFSGLLTMNPWGLLGGSSARDAEDRIAGSMAWSEARRVIEATPALPLGAAVQLRSAPLGGGLYVVAEDTDGKTRRLDAAGRPAPLQGQALIAAVAAAGWPGASVSRLTREDAYYYGHHGKVALPAWRILLPGEGLRLYVDAATGEVVRTVDADARKARWLQRALHDFDLPVLRRRPLWDLVVVPLLLGVSFGAATGAWLAIRRLRRDLGALRRRRLTGT